MPPAASKLVKRGGEYLNGAVQQQFEMRKFGFELFQTSSSFSLPPACDNLIKNFTLIKYSNVAPVSIWLPVAWNDD